MREYDYIVIGAGSAGRTAVETIREAQPGGSLLLVDAENVLPYKRTKVSKSVVKGSELDEFAIHDARWYKANGVDLRIGAAVSLLDPGRRCVTVEGERFRYGTLLLATGARPRIPFARTPRGRWSCLWTEQDSRTLHKAFAEARRVAIVGIGVLGIEAAWQARLIPEVLLVGYTPYPMAEYLDPMTGAVLAEKIQSEGIELMVGRPVQGLREGDSDIRVITPEAELSADYVVLAAGSEPEISLAESAGLRTRKGILVDGALRSSAPGIWAAGDCAEHPDGTVTGIWHSAEHQGYLAALSMLGRQVINQNPPFRLKCEVFGGFWFSAGPVKLPAGESGLGEAEVWKTGDRLWRPRFAGDRLMALSGAAPSGLPRAEARAAQALVYNHLSRSEALSGLRGASPEELEISAGGARTLY